MSHYSRYSMERTQKEHQELREKIKEQQMQLEKLEGVKEQLEDVANVSEDSYLNAEYYEKQQENIEQIIQENYIAGKQIAKQLDAYQGKLDELREDTGKSIDEIQRERKRWEAIKEAVLDFSGDYDGTNRNAQDINLNEQDLEELQEESKSITQEMDAMQDRIKALGKKR